jgi:cell division transport system ATP-binding protein
MIEVKGVSLRYPDGTEALSSIDLQVSPGELVYIIGPSGSGKTSLLKLFMGMEYATSGTVKVLGEYITKGQPETIRRLRTMIGPVFQEFKLIDGRTALENVMLGLRFLDVPRKQLRESAYSALVKVGLENKALSLVENLSWGQRQRVAIARAVARKPALILADEPTGNLDKDNALNILDLLISFKDSKTSVIITTHATHMIDTKKETKLIKMDNGSMCWERLGQI